MFIIIQYLKKNVLKILITVYTKLPYIVLGLTEINVHYRRIKSPSDL